MQVDFATYTQVPRFDKPFEVHTNANDFSIKEILMQDGRLLNGYCLNFSLAMQINLYHKYCSNKSIGFESKPII